MNSKSPSAYRELVFRCDEVTDMLGELIVSVPIDDTDGVITPECCAAGGVCCIAGDSPDE